jgi:hypothetical protein
METSQFTFNQKAGKVMPSAGKVMLTVFQDSRGVLLAHFQKCGENVNSVSYCEVLFELRDAISREHPDHWQEGYCFIIAMPDTIQPEQHRREFKNYSGNFMNICLTARTWPPATSISLVAKKSPWW